MISLGKAADMTKILLAEFLELLADEGIPINYDEEDLEEDLRVVDKFAKKH